MTLGPKTRNTCNNWRVLAGNRPYITKKQSFGYCSTSDIIHTLICIYRHKDECVFLSYCPALGMKNPIWLTPSELNSFANQLIPTLSPGVVSLPFVSLALLPPRSLLVCSRRQILQKRIEIITRSTCYNGLFVTSREEFLLRCTVS